MRLLSNSDPAHWNFPRCCWRFDRAKLGERPPGGCLTASLSPTAPASSRRKPIVWERSRRSPTRPDRRSSAVFRIVEDRSLADRIVKMAEGEELGSNLLRVDQRSCKQWSERTRGTSPDVGSRPMRAQPIACLSAPELPPQIDASLPARLPGSDIYGMIQPSRHCAIGGYVLRQQRRRWIEKP